jgi:hypothetical protein
VKSLAAALLLLAAAARAETLAADSLLPPLALADQRGATHALDPELRAVVFCRDMAAGEIVKDSVAKAGNDLFERNRAVYVVDLKGMSSFVRRWFALPGLRRRPYSVLVDEDGAKTTDFPSVSGRPTVLVLDHLRVARVAYPQDGDELLALLDRNAP